MRENTSRGAHLPSEPSADRDTSRSERSRSPEGRPLKKRRRRGLGGFLFRSLVADILCAGIVLCVFAVFHHIIPTYRQRGTVIESVSISVSPTPAPVESEKPDDEQSGEALVETPVVEDTRTEWQKKFADKFTDRVIVTDTSYTSPNISVTVTSEIFRDENDRPTSVYVADVYIGSIDCFRTYFAGGEYIAYEKESAEDMAEKSNAILAINGDFANLYATQNSFLVRNGQVYFTGKSYNSDICVLNYDGTMDVYEQRDFNALNIDDILAKQAYNSWRFGPSLLDAEGYTKDYMNVTSDPVKYVNPRGAVGYYEPGHYCFVVCDGRSDESRGLSIWQLSEYFEALGCKAAYNLDGGSSAVMLFNGEACNIRSADFRTKEDRLLGDIVLIGEPG